MEINTFIFLVPVSSPFGFGLHCL